MRKNYRNIIQLIILTVTLFCLAGCDVVSQVKEGVLAFDKSVTVGQALDGYQYFTSTNWSSFETSQGKTIVECSGDIKNSSMKLTIQFQINKDDTFGLAYAGLWQGEEEISRGGLRYLRNVYENRVIDSTLLKLELIKNKSPEFMAELKNSNM